jgi:hypothetical protein
LVLFSEKEFSSMNPDQTEADRSAKTAKRASSGAKQVLKEPILKVLLKGSNLTDSQLETLLIDLVVEDNLGTHIPYEEKASLRSRGQNQSTGVSRGAFNRTLQQARANVTKCLYTMLLLGYLGLFEFTVFRPFEEIAAKIGDYRKVRDVLAGRAHLTSEDAESYKAAERTVLSALEEVSSPLSLKSVLSRVREDQNWSS